MTSNLFDAIINSFHDGGEITITDDSNGDIVVTKVIRNIFGQIVREESTVVRDTKDSPRWTETKLIGVINRLNQRLQK